MTTSAEKIVEKISDKRRALGRGLDSLLPGPRIVGSGVATPAAPSIVPRIEASAAGPESALQAASGDAVLQIPLDLIDENPYQTRSMFESESLQQLANSIQANGVVQPVVVRRGNPGRYVLILGERRCRASKLAGKPTVPAIVRAASDQQAAEMTVVENLQRQDLNCIEQATAYARLSRDFAMTQEQIGQRVGVSRESVSNYMRVLKLPEPVLQHVREGKLGFSEARVLLTLLEPSLIPKIAEQAMQKHLSVEQLEDLVFNTNLPLQKEKPASAARYVDPNVREAQTNLERALGVRVRIKDRKGKGRIVIEYTTLEDFDRVVEMLGKSRGE